MQLKENEILKPCRHCNKRFVAVKPSRGPVASYCSHSCNVRAYRARKKESRAHPLSTIETGASKEALNGVKTSLEGQIQELRKDMAKLTNEVKKSQRITLGRVGYDVGTATAGGFFGSALWDGVKRLFTGRKDRALTVRIFEEFIKELDVTFTNVFLRLPPPKEKKGGFGNPPKRSGFQS